MSLFTKPIDEIEAADIEALVIDGELEKTRVEVKRTFEPQVIAEVIAEFANTWGGVFIAGVAEDKNKRGRERFTVEWMDYEPEHRTRLESSALASTRPPVPFEIAPVKKPDDEEKCVWVIRVQQSGEAPHEYYKGGDPCLRGRYGGRACNLDLDRIERLVARRETLRREGSTIKGLLHGGPTPNGIDLRFLPFAPRQAGYMTRREQEAISRIVVHAYGILADVPSATLTNAVVWSRTDQASVFSLTVRADAVLHLKHYSNPDFGSRIRLGELIGACARFMRLARELLTILTHPTNALFQFQVGQAVGGDGVIVAGRTVEVEDRHRDFNVFPNGHPGPSFSTGLSAETVVHYDVLREAPAEPISGICVVLLRTLGYMVDDTELLRLVEHTLAVRPG